MDEKVAMSDTLSSLNSILTLIHYSIEQSNNETFRNKLISMRSELEPIQCEIYKISRDKGYYVPAAPAGEADIEAVKTSIN